MSKPTEKFKVLTHFIINESSEHHHKLGAIRLNKALWYADTIAYQRHGKSITGDKYVRRPMGPVPRHILATLEQLQKEHKIHVQEPEFQGIPRQYISLSQPNEEVLSDEEKKLARAVLSFVCDYSANEISEMSHDIIWEAAQDGEEIPLYATLAAARGTITPAAQKWAESML